MSTNASKLSEQIEKLEGLRAQLEKVRQVPPNVLQIGYGHGVGQEFGAVKEIGEVAMSEPVQAALDRARESLQSDETGTGAEDRRVNRKRRRAASPEVYVPEDRRLLGEGLDQGVTLERLGEWARAWNQGHKSKMRIRGRTVRVAVQDVITVYMGVGVGAGGFVVVETIRAFGPREKVVGDGHGQSVYDVYQKVSQQLRRRVEEAGTEATVGRVAGLIVAYDDLFVRRCDVCLRVVSNEGHVPCVVRWFDGRRWAAEHAGCVIGGTGG